MPSKWLSRFNKETIPTMTNAPGWQVSFSAVVKWLAALLMARWLTMPAALRILVCLMIIDYVFGVATAYLTGQLSSRIGLRGLVKKGLVLGLLLAIHLGENFSGIELNLEQIGAMGYAVNELISVVENAARAGLPIPAQFIDALLAAKRLKMARATPEQLDQLEKSE
jgi:toxin secretion/phage lysis holin